jgi:hypothetical protein
VPHKGKLLAGSAIFGSSFLAAVRWLFGVWLPSLHQVGGAPGRQLFGRRVPGRRLPYACHSPDETAQGLVACLPARLGTDLLPPAPIKSRTLPRRCCAIP